MMTVLLCKCYGTASRCGPFTVTAETLHKVFILSSRDEQAFVESSWCGVDIWCTRVRVWLGNILRSGAAGI